MKVIWGGTEQSRGGRHATFVNEHISQIILIFDVSGIFDSNNHCYNDMYQKNDKLVF